MPEKKVLRIGTRASRLALAQSMEIRRRLERLRPELHFKLIKIRTAGDEFKGVEWFKKTGIGVFTKAIEKGLSENRIDLAVHSLKDLPTDMLKGLMIAAVPKRRRACDALVSRKRLSLRGLPAGALVGTGSARRAAQIRLLRPDVRIVPIRGNLDTRVAKALATGGVDAVVLAEAGLKRIARYARFYRAIPEKDMLPAVGQGTLAIQTRAQDAFTRALVKPLHHPPTARLAQTERAFLKTLRGGCRVPVGVSSRFSDGRLHFTGAVFSVCSPEVIQGSFSVRPARAEAAARRLALSLLRRGGRRFLNEARAS